MELLLFILAVCLIGLLATYFGYDSTAVPRAREHPLASYGGLWDVHNGQLEDLRREVLVWRLLNEAQPAGAKKRLRRRLADVLRELAEGLSPESERACDGAGQVLFRAPGP